MSRMPRTAISNFRIPPDIKEAAAKKAESEGKTLSRVVVDLLREYSRPNGAPQPDGWERDVTTGPRKQFDMHSPEGEGWELDFSRGRPGRAWERFDYHEEAYWRRWVGTGPEPARSGRPYLGSDGKRYTLLEAMNSEDRDAYPFTWIDG